MEEFGGSYKEARRDFMPNLTPKQLLFCQEYMKDLNGTQAAIRAGYSENTAYSIAGENLNKPEIQDKIAELKAARAARCEITADMVLREFAKIAFIDIRKFYNSEGVLKLPHELDEDAAAALSELNVHELFGYDVVLEANVKQGEAKKIKLHDKQRALENIAKHLGWYEKDNDQQTKILIQPSAEELKASRDKLQNDY
jgi:phage terminase small subunit